MTKINKKCYIQGKINEIAKIFKQKKGMDIIERALIFEKKKRQSLSTSDRVKISREAKEIILALNEVYKKDKDPEIMDIMKRLTSIKQKIEKRLKGRPLTS